MRKIILLCSAGMSSSFLVNKMKEAADKQNYECIIEAYSIGWADSCAKDADIILLGPQVRFTKENIERICPGVTVIDIKMEEYGSLNGEAVLNKAKNILGD